MKSKKFVLAALALLAITMVLLPLSGCKNDTVPETPAAKLVSISVTPPEGTVYSVGEEVVHKKDGEIEVTATYDDGEERLVTGTITTDTSTLTQSAGIGKKVTVSYTEGDTTKEATFTIDVASYEFTETVQDVDSSYAGTMTGGNYKKFGDWPQIIKKEGVEIGAGTLVRGGLTYHVGSDGNYYVKAEENAYEAGYKYSDDSEVKQKDESSSPSTQWFKVEPIVWRVLTTNYEVPEGGTAGNALLLAEKILTGGIPYYVDFNNRTITEEGTKEGEPDTVYPNNWQYSTIRAWLNGLDVVKSDDVQENDTTYTGKGFLQTAFTESAQDLIELTTVDNTAASTTDAGSNLPPATDYACANTTDNVFLLSEQEATTLNSGFAAYDASGKGNTRIRVTTDYAKATGANHTADYGGWWWLRSPYPGEHSAHVISLHGNANRSDIVNLAYGGVVPALSISLGGN